MKFRSYVVTVLALSAVGLTQVAPLASSHAPSVKVPTKTPAAVSKVNATSAKPAVRVNGAVLTEVDVLREMYSIFPYARQHNGFPKDLEPEIRKGAVDMIIFEELLYQDAKRRNVAIAPERLTKAEKKFREEFPDRAAFEQYLRTECSGSPQVLKEKIRRSMLIDTMLKTEVERKSLVSLEAARAYYNKNSKQFEHGETVAIQTISIIPPENASKDVRDEARKKILSIARLGKAAKTSRDFGLIAEQVSDDDWRTKLGDRGTVDVSKLPPEVVKAARAMKPGGVSDPIQLDRAWVVIRLNAHTPAGKTPFDEIKNKLQSDLQKQKRVEIRAALNQQLRKGAKIEVL
jgi:hypothetical protein